jgi:predicted ATPase
LLIHSLNLKEFRGIIKCEKPLEFSEFTVLVGRNNCGKSSILEALSLFPTPDYYLPYATQKKVDFVSSLHSGKSSLVYGYSGYASIEYTTEDTHFRWLLDENGMMREFAVKDKGTEFTTIEPFAFLPTVFKKYIKGGPNLSVGDMISRLVFFMPNDTSFMNDLSARTSIEANQRMMTKLGAHFRVMGELINKCIDDKYTEILLVSPQLSVRKERADGQPLYINIKDLGDGIKKAAITSLWLEAINPPLVLWDDFEGSAHPSLVRELLKWLSKKKWQVVLSTHSIDVLNSLVEVGPKETKIIQLRKGNDDVLHHETLNIHQLEDIMDSSQDPRMMVDSLNL